MNNKLTIFTPTYNRGYLLPELYNSLLKQDSKDFEWLVIDDGSTDDTQAIVAGWIAENDGGFAIRYYKVNNGGKQRAINQAVELAHSDWLFIVDSDDELTPDAVSTIIGWIDALPESETFAGVSGLKYNVALPPSGQPDVNIPSCGYVDCSNLERDKYGLSHDMAEVFKVSVLKKYPFKVWPGETFTPECVVWDKLALDGYKLRYYAKYIYIYSYREDGLTRGGYETYRKGIMGCAMAYDIKARSAVTIKDRMRCVIELLVGCVITGNFGYILKSQYPFTGLALLPVGVCYALNRKRILRREEGMKRNKNVDKNA